MTNFLTQHNLFKPKASKAETKADDTNKSSRMIIGEEAARREAKTAKLRQARLENEAKRTHVLSPGKMRGLKTSVPRRTQSSR